MIGLLRISAFSRLLLALLFCSLSGAVAAKGKAETCSAREVETTSIETIQADLMAWYQKCVRLRGLWWNGRLYTDRAALLEPVSRRGRGDRSIAMLLYSDAPNLADQRPMHVEVTGRVGSCRALWDALEPEPDSLVFVEYTFPSLPCNNGTDGYFDALDVAVIERARPPRLTEAEVPPEARELTDAPAGWEQLEAMVQAGHALFAALAERDEEAFIRLVEPELVEAAPVPGRYQPATDYVAPASLTPLLDPDAKTPVPRVEKEAVQNNQWVSEESVSEARKLYARLVKRDAPFATVPTPGMQERIFVMRGDAAYPGDAHSLLLCRCREGDCTGRWPVRWNDADNLERRPYLCVAASDYFVYPDELLVSATANVAKDGFAEPDWAGAAGTEPDADE